jgi:Uma2 family endonuclease
MAETALELTTPAQTVPHSKSPEEILYESEYGKPMPSFNHGYIQANLIFSIRLKYHAAYSTVSETTLVIGEASLTPDVLVFPKRKMNLNKDVPRMHELPVLAIEIASASQSQQDLVDKCMALLNAGVKACWLVQPAIEAVTIFIKDEKPRTFTAGMVADTISGIELSVADIFSVE